MFRKLIILGFIMQVLGPVVLYSQSRSAFSGDPGKFTSELRTFMGPNLTPEQTANLDAFIVRFDSAAFSPEKITGIVDIASHLSSRLMRPVPHFDDFIRTLNYFADYKRNDSQFNIWLNSLSELAFNPRFGNDKIDMFLRNTASTIRDNFLFVSPSVKWKVKNSPLEFHRDTSFYITIQKGTLTCLSQKDSTEIYDVTGRYYPEIQSFKGDKGRITWEKAGFDSKKVYASISNYTIITSKSSFTVDSAMLYHSDYFKTPVPGLLTDQAIVFSNKEKANYPRFNTYKSSFIIRGIYKNVDYEGGLAFEGSFVKGTGRNNNLAKIRMFRNDTLYLKITSKEFMFTKTGISSQETSMVLYLGRDSIFHTNLGFSYLSGPSEVNLFRTNNPISRSPYFDSFHNIDMYFEYLTWNMNESKIKLSRARGASMGQAQFESSSFFESEYFLKLMGLDEYHPLSRLIKFAEWYYSDTFPVAEFAKWLNKPVEAVTGLCIDMANKGFVFYDRINNEVTIKKKTRDFIDFYAKRKDYDVLSINSETKGSKDNAFLDLRNYRLTINGVRNVFLSDSQRVAIYPYDQQIIMGKNRDIQFDGVVQAGLFTVYGHNFSFSYDTFKIRLHKVDSLKLAVETGERDRDGYPVIRDVNNFIQLGTAEIYIDKPDNKSGLKSLRQYPIINSMSNSYIYYDKIPGLEGIYKQQDFFFRIDPFTYENIDHYTSEDIKLAGEFVGGNIIKPTRQFLTIQQNNSLGFNMVIPKEGIDVYNNRGRLYDYLAMSDRGLIGSGTLSHLTSETESEEYRFFPDSMLAKATTFKINDDPSGTFPVLDSKDVSIKWLLPQDEWLASNSAGKNFDMFGNGTTLDGTLKMTPSLMTGSGAIEMPDSRITSHLFNFTSYQIKADTADYNLKSTRAGAYSFIAENANTDINFRERMSRFHLNTDSSVVKFPEIQYISKMTDFTYNMNNRILNMENKGKISATNMTAEELLKVDRRNLEKPTFFATNSISDTLSFASLRGTYNLDKEYIEAEDINYIPVADALIQPDSGKIVIDRRAKIRQMKNALIALNNKHILHDAKVDIESTKRYTGSAIYDYVDENKEIQQINFPELTVDTLTTSARGFIAGTQKFMLSPAFSFSGDVMLNAKDNLLTFTGAAAIVNTCNQVKSYSIKFKSRIDPLNVLIPVSDKPRDVNDNLVFSGTFISSDSLRAYPAFLSPQKSWSDVPLVSSSGYLYYEKAKSRYIIAPLDKITNQTLPGNMVAFDRNFCVLSGEGNINFGAKYDLVKFGSAGKVTHTLDSGKVSVEAILGIDFYFSPEALKLMADEIRLKTSLKPVSLNTELNNKGMKDLFGVESANRISEEMNLFGASGNLPKDFSYKLLLNDVKLFWNESTSSFRSTGKIGIGFIGAQPVNLYVDGFIEIQRRRSGDMIDVYLKADESTWYYFSYFRGVMMAQASNGAFNQILTSTKANDRKHPESTVRVPYSYMIAVEDRLPRFLRRMASNNPDEDTPTR
jgi:hypothetical protein